MSNVSIDIRFHKWWGRLHWNFTLEKLGEDEHGVWLACRPGTPLFKGDTRETDSPGGWVKVVPRTGSWTAIWQRPEGKDDIYLDIIDQPRWSDGAVDMVDLDLDIVRRWDGGVEIHDEDEFADHAARYQYPERIIDLARSTTARLAVAVEAREEPFDTVGPTWQRRAFEEHTMTMPGPPPRRESSLRPIAGRRRDRFPAPPAQPC